jgi:hypothetical protein
VLWALLFASGGAAGDSVAGAEAARKLLKREREKERKESVCQNENVSVCQIFNDQDAAMSHSFTPNDTRAVIMDVTYLEASAVARCICRTGALADGRESALGGLALRMVGELGRKKPGHIRIASFIGGVYM